MLLNSLSAPADLAHRLADVTYQIVALQTLNHAMGTDHPSLTDAIVDAAQHRRITGREERILQDLNDQANASKHDDLGPGRLYRPSLEGGPHLRKVVIVSGPESSVKWEELTELVALSAGALDEMVVGSFPMEGKAKRAPYVAVQSGMAAPTLLPPCWGVGRGAFRGPPTSRSGRPRSVSVGRRGSLRRGCDSSPLPGTAQERAGHSSPMPGGDRLRGSASYSLPPVMADPPKVSRWRTATPFDGSVYGSDYLRFSAGEFMMFVEHPKEDSLWAFGRLLERAASPQLGWFPRDYVDPVDEITRREGSEPPHSGTLSDPSTRASPGLLADAPASAPLVSTSSGELWEEGMQGRFRVIAENVQDGSYTVLVSDASGVEIGTRRWSRSHPGLTQAEPAAGHQEVPAARAAGAGCQPAAGAGCQPVASARPHPAPVAAGPSPAPIWAESQVSDAAQ